MAQSFFSVNIELNEKRTNRGYLTCFFQADDTSNVAELKDPCSFFFLYFCLQQEEAVENILQHYVPVLKFGINDLA